MESTLSHTLERQNRIGLIERTLSKIKEDNRMIDEEKFVLKICEQFQVSWRTAREYIKIAKSRVKW